MAPFFSKASNLRKILNFSFNISSGDNLGLFEYVLSGSSGILLKVLKLLSTCAAVALPTFILLLLLLPKMLFSPISILSSVLSLILSLGVKIELNRPLFDGDFSDFSISSVKLFSSASRSFKSPKSTSLEPLPLPSLLRLSFINNSIPPPKLTEGLSLTKLSASLFFLDEEKSSLFNSITLLSKLPKSISITSAIIN